MTLTEEIDQLQTELADYRTHVPSLKKALDQALAEIATLERRLDISERQRAVHASRVGEMMNAMNNCQLIWNHVMEAAALAGFKPAEGESVAIPTPAAPEHGGGQQDDGQAIPAFLTNGEKKE